MPRITFITGNIHKVKYVSSWLGHDLDHHKLDLPEIQSVDVREVTRHKAEQAYELLQAPVLVEDCALIFHAISPLPGTFIKWFEMPGLEAMCRMLDGFSDRSANARLNYCLYDGEATHFFEGEMKGVIAQRPSGSGGFGFDPIFMNEGHTITRAEMSEKLYKETSYRYKALQALADFLRKNK